MVAELKPDGTINVVQNKVASEELARIAQRNRGALTPAAVVEAASDESNPLHSYFEWDDSRAGAAFRLAQAAMLIRTVKIKLTVRGRSDPISVRLYHNVAPGTDKRGNDRGVYVTLDQVASSEAYRSQLLERALSELESFKAKYAALSELSGVFRAIEKVRPKKK